MTTSAQDDDLRKLDGTWLFVEDRTGGCAFEKGEAPMSSKFKLRIEKTQSFTRAREAMSA